MGNHHDGDKDEWEAKKRGHIMVCAAPGWVGDLPDRGAVGDCPHCRGDDEVKNSLLRFGLVVAWGMVVTAATGRSFDGGWQFWVLYLPPAFAIIAYIDVREGLR